MGVCCATALKHEKSSSIFYSETGGPVNNEFHVEILD